MLVRKGYATGQIMVVRVLASPILPSKNNFVKALRKKHPKITTVVLNVNDKRTSMVLGDRNITLYGKGFIEEMCIRDRDNMTAIRHFLTLPQTGILRLVSSEYIFLQSG